MNIKFIFSFAAALLLSTAVFAADKLAIAEPVGKGGVKTEDIEAFWGILEASIQSDEYKLISRGALKQMMTEIGLTTGSDLMNLNSAQKAKLGQIETVKYILVSEIGKFGSQLNCTMKILDSSTGEIDQARTANVRVKNLDQLADEIESVLEKMLSDDKQMTRSAVLNPIVTYKYIPQTQTNEGWTATFSPKEIPDNFNVRLQNELIRNGVRLQNLGSIAKILQKNNLDALDELEPKMYKKIGKLLEVQYLIQAVITRFEINGLYYSVAETGAQGYIPVGDIEGRIEVISAQTGEKMHTVVFEQKIDFRRMSRETKYWTISDYGKYMIKTVIPYSIMPELLPVFKGEAAETAEK